MIRGILASTWIVLPTFVACTDAPSTPIAHGRLDLRVAPLNLPGIAVACYDVEARNDRGEVVWHEGDPGLSHGDGDTRALCSDRYGNSAGGDLAYVGPCDAVDNDGDGTATGSVTLWVDGLYDATGTALKDWVDPCPLGCTMSSECVENATSPVEFNLTIMRQAHQGFFDLMILLDDVFCAAKLDNCTDEGSVLTMLEDQGVPMPSAVLAFACTTGKPGSEVLYSSDIAIQCDSETGSATVPATSPEGTHPLPGKVVFAYSMKRGNQIYLCDPEDPTCGCDPAAGNCRELYWNTVIGYRPGDESKNCHVVATLSTAYGTQPFVETERGFVTPVRSTYPIVTVDVAITDADGQATCTKNPLNGPTARVRTEYTPISDEGVPFCSSYDGLTPRRAAACLTP